MTLDLNAVREWRPLDAYPATPYRGEDMRAVLRSAMCACGDAVTHLSGELAEDAVRRHNAGWAHQLWRAEREGAA